MCSLYKYILLTALLCLFSCVAERKSDNAFAPDLLGEAAEEIRYSQFVDSLEYIPLETTDECLIGKIKDVYIGRERVFVLDGKTQTVWMFDRKGYYLNKLSRRGKGPGEYTNMQQFEVDEKNRQLILLDIWTNKLLFYDWEGRFLKDIRLEMTAMDFKPLPSGGFVVSQEGYDKETAGVYLADNTGKVIRQLVKRNSHSSVYYELDWELCSVAGEVAFMAPIFENDVYHFDGQELSCPYTFDMQPALKHYYGKDASFRDLEDFVRTQYIETDHWIYAAYWSAVHDLRYFLFSKRERKYRIGKKLVNDVDGKPVGGRTSATVDNTFTFWYMPEGLEDANPVLQVMHLK